MSKGIELIKRKRLIIGISIGVGLVVLGVILFLVFNKKDESLKKENKKEEEKEVVEEKQELLPLYVNDIKTCILDSKYKNFKTKATIRVDAGGSISNIIEQLAIQMSSEYYYNTIGNLSLYATNESMNDVNKPIVWVYNEDQIEGLQFAGEDEIINVVKVVGTNIDGRIYSAIVKNTNLNSPINIYHIKERKMAPIDTASVWSDEMAEELAQFNLRKKSILNVKQQCTVPYNPLLMVNNIIEVDNKELNMKRERYIINGISYTSGSATMTIDIANITNLPLIGGINYNGQ